MILRRIIGWGEKNRRRYKHIFAVVAVLNAAVLVFQWYTSYLALESSSMESLYYFTKSNVDTALSETGEMLEDIRATLVSLSNEPVITRFWSDGPLSREDMKKAHSMLNSVGATMGYGGEMYVYGEDSGELFLSGTGEYATEELKEEFAHVMQLIPREDRKEMIKTVFIAGEQIYQSRLCIAYYPHINSENCIIKEISGTLFIKNFTQFDLYKYCKYAVLRKDKTVLYSNFAVAENELAEWIKKGSTERSFETTVYGGEKYFYNMFEGVNAENSIIILLPKKFIYSNEIFDRLSDFFNWLGIILILVLVLAALLWKLLVKYEQHMKETYLIKSFEEGMGGDKQKLLEEILEKSEQIEWENLPEMEFAAFLHGKLVLILIELEKTQNKEVEETEIRKYMIAEEICSAFKPMRAEQVMLDGRQVCIIAETTEDAVQRKIKEILAKTREKTDIRFSAVIGDVITWKELKYEMSRLGDAMEYRYIYGENADIEKQVQEMADDRVFAELMENATALKKEILTGSTDGAFNSYNMLWDNVSRLTPDTARIFVLLLLGVYRETFEALALKTGLVYDFDYGSEIKSIMEEETLLKIKRRFEGYSALMESVGNETNTNRQDYICAEAKRFIENNYGNTGLGTDMIAEQLGLSSGHLGKLFKKTEGVTVLRYILNIRMQKAKELLDNNDDMSIQQIAEAVGYSNYSYFGALFKQEFHITPGAYRMAKKNV